MSLTILDTDVMKKNLTAIWQIRMNTGDDPANWTWYTTGADDGGNPGGLYGALTDSAATTLNFDDANKQYIPSDISCDTATIDNTNGLAPQSTVTLTFQHSIATEISHNITDSIKVGAEFDIEGKATFFGSGVDVTTKFSFDYTHTWGSATSSSVSDTTTFSHAVPVTVPIGKIYQVQLTASSQQLTVPYTAAITVTGYTETWFKDRIGYGSGADYAEHYNWQLDAGTAFDLINTAMVNNFSPLPDNQLYSGNNGAGYVTQSGTLTTSQTANFVVKVFDITGGGAILLKEIPVS